MGVLHVKHRVVVAVAQEYFRLDSQRRVCGVATQRIAQGIGTEPFAEVVEFDDVAGALRQPGTVDAHQLADEYLNVFLGVVSGRPRERLQPMNVAVVVCPE